jgi:hypothetical protein
VFDAVDLNVNTIFLHAHFPHENHHNHSSLFDLAGLAPHRLLARYAGIGKTLASFTDLSVFDSHSCNTTEDIKRRSY